MEDFCAERMEPALEPCMKMQRRTGVNGEKERAERERLLIRVVPPKENHGLGPFALRMGAEAFVRLQTL